MMYAVIMVTTHLAIFATQRSLLPGCFSRYCQASLNVSKNFFSMIIVYLNKLVKYKGLAHRRFLILFLGGCGYTF